MSGHTKGPWNTCITDLQLGLKCLSIESDKGFIAEAWGHNVEREEQIANAHLIASAPELLEALEGVVRRADSDRAWQSARGMDDEYPDRPEIMFAREVIAKARGQA